MSSLIRALSGNPDRTEAFRDWLGMYVATMTIATAVLLAAR